MAQAASVRIGGHLVVESLEALGADTVFGLPGIHALAIWEALRTSGLRSLAFRSELNAGFAADGYARVSGRPAPLVLSTGPGALDLARDADGGSELPRAGGGDRLADPERPARPRPRVPARAPGSAGVVRADREVGAQAGVSGEIPGALAEAWRRALTPPTGPVFVEIPVDFLTGEAQSTRVGELDAGPAALPLPPAADVAEAAALLAAAERPVVWAGGGVLRSGAWEELRVLAERLDAPVVTTFMGKGAFPEDHALFAGSACYDPNQREILESADVLLVVGSELGSETTYDYTLAPAGRIVQIDADAGAHRDDLPGVRSDRRRGGGARGADPPARPGVP